MAFLTSGHTASILVITVLPDVAIYRQIRDYLGSRIGDDILDRQMPKIRDLSKFCWKNYSKSAKFRLDLAVFIKVFLIFILKF